MHERARRTAAVLMALAALGISTAQAHPTIRLQPDPVIFPPSETYSTLSVSVYIDDIPAPGIGNFTILLKARARGPDGPSCVQHLPSDLGTLDPDLKNGWGYSFHALQSLDGGTAVLWSARGVRPYMPPGGSLRVGSLRWRVRMGALPVGCFPGMQDWFRWGRDDTMWGPMVVADQPFGLYMGAPWFLAYQVPLDLTLACNRSTNGDPNFFVDGDIITVACDLFNSGLHRTDVIPWVGTFFSQDEVITGIDPHIISSRQGGAVPGRSSTSVTMSAQPVQRVPQVINICTKVDVDPNYQGNARGLILETNESNNVDCGPITVIRPHRDMVFVPGSASVGPDPRDPNGMIRAGLNLELTYDVLNQGIGAVRQPHRNEVYIGDTLDQALADPNLYLCGMDATEVTGLPQVGGAVISYGFGLGTGSSTELCKIPFRYPEGGTSLFVVLDTIQTVIEEDPNFDPGPAESNNTLEIPIVVRKPLDPELRVQHRRNFPNDHDVELFGPGTGTSLLTVASARGLRAYQATMRWSPVTTITLGDPNVPGGDPNGVEFLPFLEQGGLAQSCSVDQVDPVAGIVGISCVTTDPGGSGVPAVTEEPDVLARLTWTTLLPGPGTFTITSFSALDGDGNPYPGLRKIDGTFIVDGVPDLSVLNASSPPEIYPGYPFSASWDILNDGFGIKRPPLITELVVSLDDVLEYGDPNSPDERACFISEATPLPGKTTVPRTAAGCRLTQDYLPGLYTGFYQVQLGLDPNKGETDLIPLPSRLIALRSSSRGRVADTHRAPSQPGDSVGARLARGRGFRAGSLASVSSVERNRNWLVGLTRSPGGKRRLKIFRMPLDPSRPLEVLRGVRLPKEDKRVLGSADIDGDGDDELILLQRSSKEERLDFRRIDFGKIFPQICQTAAETAPFAEGILGATGLQFDADPEDELVVATGDGGLAIYDVTLNGAVPPARPCDPVPVILYEPASADLSLLASDPAFGPAGEEVRALCAMDDALDGTEEIAALFSSGRGIQAVQIFQPPAGPGGQAVRIADDPAFGGTGGKGRVFDLSCTR